MNTHPDDDLRLTTSNLDEAPMDDELCVFVHALLDDGRPLSPQLVERARRWAAEHPSAAREVADLEAIGAALARDDVEPSASFTDAVLAARRAPVHVDEVGAARGGVLPLVRRLSVAAALAIVATIGWGMLEPDALFADDDPASLEVERTHRADEFTDERGRATERAFEEGLDGLIEPDPRLSERERARLEENDGR